MSENPAIPVVIDTNVLVPSIYSYTPLARFIYKGFIVPVWNDFSYLEACKVTSRLATYYLKKDRLSAEEALTFLNYMFFSLGLKVSNMPDDWTVVVINDRDDDNFLWAAVAGNAEYIISEDSHMLKLKVFKDIPIGTSCRLFSVGRSGTPYTYLPGLSFWHVVFST